MAKLKKLMVFTFIGILLYNLIPYKIEKEMKQCQHYNMQQVAYRRCATKRHSLVNVVIYFYSSLTLWVLDKKVNLLLKEKE